MPPRKAISLKAARAAYPEAKNRGESSIRLSLLQSSCISGGHFAACAAAASAVAIAIASAGVASGRDWHCVCHMLFRADALMASAELSTFRCSPSLQV